MKRDVVEIGSPERPVRGRVSAEEWRLRCELAAAHRLVAHFVFVDMTYNHISVRVPGEPDRFLVKADNVFMEQVTASNLVKYDLEGNLAMESGHKASPAAYHLHAAVLKARPDIAAAVHTHSPANLAVSAQKGGLRPITQQAMRFYNRIAYYPNEVDDTTPEGTALLARARAAPRSSRLRRKCARSAPRNSGASASTTTRAAIGWRAWRSRKSSSPITRSSRHGKEKGRSFRCRRRAARASFQDPASGSLRAERPRSRGLPRLLLRGPRLPH